MENLINLVDAVLLRHDASPQGCAKRAIACGADVTHTAEWLKWRIVSDRVVSSPFYSATHPLRLTAFRLADFARSMYAAANTRAYLHKAVRRG